MLTERIWGYRAIEKTILDMRRGSTSNDLGIGLQAKIGEKGNFGYNVLVGNGSAQRLETDIFKKVYGDVWAKFLNQKLVIDLFGDYERTQLAIGNHRYIANAKLAVIYTTDAFTVGVEAYTELQHNYVGYSDSVGLAVVHYTVDAMVLGISGYVRGNIIKDKLNFFARYDYFNPETDFNPDLTYTNGASPVTETFITAGVDFTPHKNVHIMPNLWYNGHSSRAKNASGHIKSDYDMVPRLTIWYVFR